MQTLLEVNKFRTADGQRLIKPSPDQAEAMVALSRFELVKEWAEPDDESYFKAFNGGCFPWEDVYGIEDTNPGNISYGLVQYLKYLRHTNLDIRLINGYAFQRRPHEEWFIPSFDPYSVEPTEKQGYLPSEICHDGWGAPDWVPLQVWEILIQGDVEDEWTETGVFTIKEEEHLILNPKLYEAGE